MDLASLLILACVGGLVLGVWDLTRHGAADVIRSLMEFLAGLLLGAGSFLVLPEQAATVAFLIAAIASSFIAWKGLDRVILRRVRSVSTLGDGEDELDGRLALHKRADSLESHGGQWLGPTLALAFAIILAGVGVPASDIASLFVAAVVMVVPFGRLARHHVEQSELRELARLLASSGEGRVTLPDVSDS